MLRIKMYQSSKSMENYLNNKSSKGYILDTINTFGLFEPLRLDAYQFKKSEIRDRVYKIDSRMVSQEEFGEYKQIFMDDGWHYFTKNYVNDNINVDHIFYSDDPGKHEIFSDEESERKRNLDNASLSIYKGFILSIIFIFISILFPSLSSNENTTILGFILHNLYIIVAILIIIVSLTRYIKNK